MISIAQFKRELQDARLIRLRAHGAERRRSKTGVWRTEDRRVRQIERLRAELQREPLLQLRVLVQRDVRAPRVVAASGGKCPRRSPEVVRRGRTEHLRIEPRIRVGSPNAGFSLFQYSF